MLPPRIRNRVNVDPATGCWVWAGTIQRGGYGNACLGGRVRPAHRVFYEDARGSIPEGLDLDHLCRNRACVNPDHLEPVTRAVNIQRGKLSKLNDMVVREIRERREAGETYPSLAREYGVSVWTVWQAATRRQWKNVA
jgi:hypothetical protein